MALCGVCGIVCSNASSIKCTACENSFHLHCVKTESEEKIKRNTKDWKCALCKGKSSTLGSVKSNVSTSDPLTKDFLINVMESFKKEVFSEIAVFKNEVTELSTSVQFVSNMLDASNILMEEIKKKLTEVQTENQALKANLTNSFSKFFAHIHYMVILKMILLLN
uniref:PHD-type domain-containing protein n=1 Tax=Homalodisca liturata TaxID=320908 RepID=A0A1B6JIY4_9HEMI